MKRIGSCLLLMLPLLLASCGNNSPIGIYSFQMGKSHSTHMRASITLQDSPVTREGVVLGNAMELYVQAKMGGASSSSKSTDISSQSSEESVVSSQSSEVPFFPDFDDLLMSLLSNGITVHGYYSIVPSSTGGNDRLNLGFTLEDLQEITGETIDLDHEVIEKIVYSEYDGKRITLSIPVSMTDLLNQLYWYGFDLYDLEAEIKEHDLNTHPTAEDVAEINKTYPDTHGGNLYRDFHCISLGLTKE